MAAGRLCRVETSSKSHIAGAAVGMNFPDASNGKQPELHI
jgi:hypothetical protein